METWHEPGEELLETPVVEAITSIGKIPCTYFNANLIRHFDPYDNYLEYNDGEMLHKLNVLDTDWNAMVELDFPWEYWPDLEQVSVDNIIKVKYGGVGYEFHPSNTILRLFKDSQYDHAEHSLNPGNVRGMKLVKGLKEKLFKGEYPIKYLPYVDRASQEWYDKINGKGEDE